MRYTAFAEEFECIATKIDFASLISYKPPIKKPIFLSNGSGSYIARVNKVYAICENILYFIVHIQLFLNNAVISFQFFVDKRIFMFFPYPINERFKICYKLKLLFITQTECYLMTYVYQVICSWRIER